MIYFSNGNAAHRVHGPMDYGRAWSTGPWWTTGGSSQKAHWSPALRPLRWVGAHRELGETERRSRGSSPWVRVGGGGRAFGAEGEKREAGGAVGEVAGVSVPFIGPEARERRRSVRELGRRPLMAPFKRGRKWGGETESRGGEGGGGDDSLCNKRRGGAAHGGGEQAATLNRDAADPGVGR
jgi:hypothetical protein